MANRTNFLIPYGKSYSWSNPLRQIVFTIQFPMVNRIHDPIPNGKSYLWSNPLWQIVFMIQSPMANRIYDPIPYGKSYLWSNTPWQIVFRVVFRMRPIQSRWACRSRSLPRALQPLASFWRKGSNSLGEIVFVMNIRVPRQSLGRGRQKSISPQGSGCQKSITVS